jgi:RecB family exonuclease
LDHTTARSPIRICFAAQAKKFGSDFVHSASGLSVYGNCPYRFFAQRVLRSSRAAKPRSIYRRSTPANCCTTFCVASLNASPRGAAQTGSQETAKGARAIADAVFDEHERVVPPLNKQIWKIDREIRKILLDQVLLYELEIQEEAKATASAARIFRSCVWRHEVGGERSGFERRSRSSSRAKTFVGEESIKISGQIDRVDVARDNTLIAYDYKLSTGSSRSDIISGRSLQLPIYLEALEKLILPDQPIAGGGYYVIRGAQDRRNKGLYRASQLDYLHLRAKNSVFTDDDWQRIRTQVVAKIWEFLDGMRAGSSSSIHPSVRRRAGFVITAQCVATIAIESRGKKKRHEIKTDAQITRRTVLIRNQSV